MPAEERWWSGSYFDGRSAARHYVQVRVRPDGLSITGSSINRSWPYAEVRQTQGRAPGEPVRLEYGTAPAEVLVVSDESFLRAVREAAPAQRGRFKPPAARSVRVVLFILTPFAIAASLVVLFGWGLPAFVGSVARRIPVSWERQLGEAVVEHLAPEDQRCGNPATAKAMQTILARLTAGSPPSPYRYDVYVISSDIPNAFAAPGGTIVFTAGLLELTSAPEEVAGVMAHEIQHVLQRHGTQSIVRELSLRALLRLATGDLGGLGTALKTAGQIGALQYRREDEASADRGAVVMLAAARVDPRGMVTVLEKMRDHPMNRFQPPAYLSTHPALDERIAELTRLTAGASVSTPPLLPGRTWSALVRCAP